MSIVGSGGFRKILDFAHRRRVGTLALTLAYSVRERRVHRFAVDAEGRWVNAQEGRAIVSPLPHTKTLDAVRRTVRDLWCHEYVPRPGDVVVDLGAGIGEDTLVMSELVGRTGRVISVEAHPATAACLAETVRRSALANVTVLPVAVSDRTGSIRISTTENHLANSIVHGAEEGAVVSAVRLDDLMARQGLDHIDLLKVNIEGAETGALAGLGTAITRVRNVAVSCHDFVADRGGDASLRTHENVRRLLADAGFSLSSRPADPRPWVRYYVYGRRPQREG